MSHESATDNPTQTGVPKLARIGPFGSLIDANLAVGRLNEEGIDASLAGEHLAATLGPIYGAAYAGGPFVLVPEPDAVTARQILDTVDTARHERMDAESPPCTRGHRPTTRVLSGLRWAGLVLLALAFFIAPLRPIGFGFLAAGVAVMLWPTTPVWACPTCRARFTAPVPAQPPDAD